MTRHLDHLIWLLRVVDIPPFDRLRDAIQICEGRSQLPRCIGKHLVDGRFSQTCARPLGILLNEGLNAALARFLAIDLKHSNLYKSPAAYKTTRLPEWQSLHDIGRPTNLDPKPGNYFQLPRV